MDLATVFADLDRVAWSELHHAYGPAGDVPDLLRALTAADPEAVAEAEYELWSGLVHQGTVYEATVAAVPFLARLAAAGLRRAELLGMLGAVAESTDEHGPARPGAARAAVVAQLPLVLPLLADAAREVRQYAAWTVGHCGQDAGPEARAALRRRWAAETDPVVRADVLTACVLVDRDAAEELCAAALRAAEPPAVRVAALLARGAAGCPWDEESAAELAALLPLRPHLAGSRWEREPLKALTVALHERGDVDAAIDLVAVALDRAARELRSGADPGAAAGEATWAAQSLALRSRSAPARLLPAMLPLLDAPATAGGVSAAVSEWAVPAPQAVPALVRLAEGTDEPADRALAALVTLGASEAADLLARHLPDRPYALEAAFRRAVQKPPAPLPCTPALLLAVRDRLAARTADASTPRERPSLTAGGLAAVNEPVHLIGLLAGWGPAARDAVPELVDALPHRPAPVARALAVVADARLHPGVAAALRERAVTGSLPDRQEAATALHARTGDMEPLLTVLALALGERSGSRDHAVRAAASLGEQARPLLPHLLALLAEPAESRADLHAVEAGLAAAAAVWDLTGDQEAVLPVVLEGLTWPPGFWFHRVANHAARVAALLGPAARPAVVHLLPMLDRPDTAAAAARALVAAHPGSDRPAGVTLTDLVDRVRAAAGPVASQRSVLAALDTLAALGPAAFTPIQIESVRQLAEGDSRIVGLGSHTELIREDEEVRTVARRVLADLTR
ncbi:hypothetical protein [Kitasatospora sp. NPDC085879]|uniref:hypothetical protein n=1 Tax=Kitasatospora sp. NPDC085879 TaxID=3154769 RepID=UPI0034296949